MSSIEQSYNTLRAKGYSDAEIQAIQFSVPKGDNRRRDTLASAASSYPDKRRNVAPAAPAAPKPIIPAPPPSKIGDSGGSRLKINKKAKRSRGQLRGGTTQQRIALNTPASNAGGVNVGGG